MNLCYTNLFNRSLKSIKKDQSLLKNLNTQLGSKIETILCFDISHISGSSAVGSSIYYDESGFNKKYYRKYNIVNTKKSDDYAALKEIIERRLLKVENFRSSRIMVIVDGGKGQITQARKVIEKLECKNTLIIGIHKGLNRLSKNDKATLFNASKK